MKYAPVQFIEHLDSNIICPATAFTWYSSIKKMYKCPKWWALEVRGNSKVFSFHCKCEEMLYGHRSQCICERCDCREWSRLSQSHLHSDFSRAHGLAQLVAGSAHIHPWVRGLHVGQDQRAESVLLLVNGHSAGVGQRLLILEPLHLRLWIPWNGGHGGGNC